MSITRWSLLALALMACSPEHPSAPPPSPRPPAAPPPAEASPAAPVAAASVDLDEVMSRAEALHRAKRYDEAIATLRQAATTLREPRLSNELGYMLALRGRSQDALAMLERAERELRDKPDARIAGRLDYNLATVHLKAKRLARASMYTERLGARAKVQKRLRRRIVRAFPKQVDLVGEPLLDLAAGTDPGVYGLRCDKARHGVALCKPRRLKDHALVVLRYRDAGRDRYASLAQVADPPRPDGEGCADRPGHALELSQVVLEDVVQAKAVRLARVSTQQREARRFCRGDCDCREVLAIEVAFRDLVLHRGQLALHDVLHLEREPAEELDDEDRDYLKRAKVQWLAGEALAQPVDGIDDPRRAPALRFDAQGALRAGGVAIDPGTLKSAASSATPWPAEAVAWRTSPLAVVPADADLDALGLSCAGQGELRVCASAEGSAGPIVLNLRRGRDQHLYYVGRSSDEEPDGGDTDDCLDDEGSWRDVSSVHLDVVRPHGSLTLAYLHRASTTITRTCWETTSMNTTPPEDMCRCSQASERVRRLDVVVLRAERLLGVFPVAELRTLQEPSSALREHWGALRHAVRQDRPWPKVPQGGEVRHRPLVLDEEAIRWEGDLYTLKPTSPAWPMP